MKEATKDADGPSEIVNTPSIILRRTDKGHSGGVLGTAHQQCNLRNEQRGQFAHLSRQTSVSPPKSLVSRHTTRGPSVSPRDGLKILSEASARLSEADDLVTKNLRTNNVQRTQTRQFVPKAGLTSFSPATLSNTPLDRVTMDANGEPVQSVVNRQSCIHGPQASLKRKNSTNEG